MKKTFFSFITTFLTTISLFGQDTIYLNNKKQIVLKKEAEYYKIVSSNKKQSPYYENTYLLNGQLKFETIYKNHRKKKLIKHYAWYDSGEPFLEINYYNGKKDGEFKTFWKNGNLRRKDIYKKGEIIKGICWNEKGIEVPYFAYEQQPKFPGGAAAFKKYLKDNIPDNQNSNLEVIIKFYIDCTGKITDYEFIKKSNNPSLDVNIVTAIMSMPDWKPAKQENKNVGVWRTLPLKF